MCIKFIAKTLNVSPSQVTIVSGQTGRNKIIRIEDMEIPEFLEKIHLSNL